MAAKMVVSLLKCNKGIIEQDKPIERDCQVFGVI